MESILLTNFCWLAEGWRLEFESIIALNAITSGGGGRGGFNGYGPPEGGMSGRSTDPVTAGAVYSEKGGGEPNGFYISLPYSFPTIPL